MATPLSQKLQRHKSKEAKTQAGMTVFKPPRAGSVSMFDVPPAFLQKWGGQLSQGTQPDSSMPVVVDMSGKWSERDQQQLRASLNITEDDKSSSESDLEDVEVDTPDQRNDKASVKSEVSVYRTR